MPARRRPRSKLRVLTRLALLVVVVIVGLYLYSDRSPVGHFRSVEGERSYKQSYAEAMKLLPAPARTVDVATTFGAVRAYEFRNVNADAKTQANATPIVLLPGRTSGVPMWASNLNGLLAAAPGSIYALDALGDAGLSVQTRAIETSGDQADWLEQTIAQLRLERVHLVGHSFGGWLAANYAARHPARVRTLALLEPVFVFQGLRWQVYAVTIPAALPFLPQRWRDRMLEQIGGVSEIDRNDPMTALIANATDSYAVKLPLPDRLTEDQLHALTMPVYAALAANSFMHDAVEAERVAKATVPNQNLTIKIWPGATHSLPMEQPREIDDALLAFFAAHESR
jgi:pimeloyl-ACP methyl ester carboxylesterase